MAKLIALLHRVSPFGPIFAKELRVTSRRKRSYWLRFLYLGALLLFLMMVYAGTRGFYRGPGVAARNQQMALLGMAFFSCFAVFSTIAMGVIGPVLTCTAVGGERLAKTLGVLLMTPISAWQIVAGKLFSRLLVAFTLIGLSLPVLAIVRLLGGVELDQMVAVVCVAAATATGTAAIGLFFSTLSNRAYVVILYSFVALFILYLFIPFVVILSRDVTGGPGVLGMQLLAIFNPFFFSMMIASGSSRSVIGGSTGWLWVWCAGVQLAMAAFLLAMSALLIRRAARREGERPAKANVEPDEPIAAEASDPLAAPKPRKKTKRNRKTRDVGDNPIVWREVRRPLMNTRQAGVIGAGIVGGIILITYLAFTGTRTMDYYEIQTLYACTYNAFAWLFAAVLAATAVAQEKEGDTWTLLLATPVSGNAVVWGKALGVLRRLLWPAVFVAGHFVLFASLDQISFWACLLVVWVILSFNTLWVATGIYLSVRLKKATSAVICNLMLAIGIYVFMPVIAQMISGFGGPRNLSEQTCWYLPYYYIAGGMWGFSRWTADPRFPHNMYSNDFRLPGSGTFDMIEFFEVVFGIGVIFIILSVVILIFTARRFDSSVARARQIQPWDARGLRRHEALQTA